MPYIVIENFKYGLDSRRGALTSLPGTLVTANNVHINAGGEIEKRQAFVVGDHTFPTNTFGLQDSDSGLLTFGAEASANAALPTGVNYMQLAHPTGVKSGGGAPTMSDVLFSNTYKGKPFVIAKFDTNEVFAYYNGALVADSRYGKLLYTGAGTLETASNLSTDLALMINTLQGWRGFDNYTSITGQTVVASPQGIHFQPTVTLHATNGVVGYQLTAQNYAGRAVRAANATFQLTGGAAGSVTVTAPLHSDGTGTANISNGAVPFNTSLNQTATDIVAAINATTYIYGYTAVVNAANVIVYAPAAWGNVTFNLTVTPVTITVGAGAAGTSLAAVLSPASLSVINSGGGRTKTVGGQVSVLVSGVTGTSTAAWSEVEADGTTAVVTPSGIRMGSTTGLTNFFSANLTLNTSKVGYFKCVVTNGTSVTVVLSVYLEYDSIN